MRRSTAELLALGDVESVLAFHRATFGDARAEDPPAAGTPTSGDAGGAGQGTPAGVPQDQVNGIVAREVAAAKAKAETDLATALGVTIDEAKQIVADRKNADDAKKTQAERDAAAAETAKQQAETDRTAAARERHEARLERALSRAGLDVDNNTMRRAGLAALDVAADADADAITAAVEKLKTDAPALFGAAPAGTPAAPTSTPPHAPRPPAPSNTMAAAREKAREQVVALGLADAPRSA